MVESFYFCFAEFQAPPKGFPRFPKLCSQHFQIMVQNHFIFDFFKKKQTKNLHQQKQKDVFLWKVQIKLCILCFLCLHLKVAEHSFCDKIACAEKFHRRHFFSAHQRLTWSLHFGVSSTRTKSNKRSISKNRLICHHYKVSTQVLPNK